MLWIALIVSVLFLTLMGTALLFTRHENGGRLAFTPIIVCLIIEGNLAWPAACHAYYTGTSDDLYTIFVVTSCTAMLVAGYLLGQTIIRKRVRPADFINAPLTKEALAPQFRAIATFAVLLSLLGFYFFGGIPTAIRALGTVAMDGLHSGIAGEAAHARQTATKGHYFGGEYRGQGAIRAVNQIAWPFLVSLSILGYGHCKRKSWLLLSGFTLLLSFTFIAGDGTRAPFLWLLITVLVTLSFQLRINIRKCLVAAGIMFLVLFAMSVPKKFADFAHGGSLMEAGTSKLAERIFVGNGSNTVLVIELVRDEVLYLRWGDVLATKFINALPFVSGRPPLAYELFVTVNADAGNRTTYYSMTALGEIYADFGWAGSLAFFLFFGVAVSGASSYCFSRRKTLTSTAVAGMLSTKIGLITLNGPISLLAWFVVFVTVLILYQMLASFISEPTRKKLFPTSAEGAIS